MKEIRLTQITVPDPASPYLKDRLYRIDLGNGHRFETVSLNKAKSFLARCNRYLNLQLHAINDLYSQVFTVYRQNWFYLDSDPGRDQAIQKTFEAIDQRLKLAVERSGWQNGNSFVFSHLDEVLTDLEDLCEYFAQLQYRKSNMPDYWRIVTLSQRCTRIRMDIKQCGSPASVGQCP